MLRSTASCSINSCGASQLKRGASRMSSHACSTAQHVVKLGTRDECFGTYEFYRTSGMKEGDVLPRPTE